MVEHDAKRDFNVRLAKLILSSKKTNDDASNLAREYLFIIDRNKRLRNLCKIAFESGYTLGCNIPKNKLIAVADAWNNTFVKKRLEEMESDVDRTEIPAPDGIAVPSDPVRASVENPVSYWRWARRLFRQLCRPSET